MKINVELWAFGDGKIRVVEIPDSTPEINILEEVFYWGQNDFQPVEGCYSVSVGDIICLNDKKVIVLGVGFKEICDEQYQEYIALPESRDRTMWLWDFEK